jgi:adenosine deaminase
VLEVQRIDHGVRALEDADLVKRLVRERMPLTVCPLSNVKLCVYKRLQDHNLKRMLELGLCATVNSDDPAYFGGYVNQNYTECADALALTREQLATLARNSFEASFASPEQKRRYEDRLGEYLAA